MLVAAAVCVAAATGAAATDGPPMAPRWDHDPVLTSDAGYVQLVWTPPEGETEHLVYELQEGAREDFAGSDRVRELRYTRFFESGLADGTFFYRVRARRPGDERWGPWSDVVRIEVSHHPRSVALALMGLGALVFVATAAFLVVHRNDRDGVSGDGR